MSTSPSTSGAKSFGSSDGSCCPSPSICTATSKPLTTAELSAGSSRGPRCLQNVCIHLELAFHHDSRAVMGLDPGAAGLPESFALRRVVREGGQRAVNVLRRPGVDDGRQH